MSMIQSAMSSAGFWDRISEWYADSVISELIAYLSDRYFSVEFGNYENFSLSSNAGVTVRNIVLALALGFILAALITAYTRVVLGGFVRKLLREECHSPANAKTLMELGYFRSVSIRSALVRGAALRMVVRYCKAEEREAAIAFASAKPSSEEEGASEPPATPERRTGERIDFLSDAFYIPEELRYRAEIRFDSKGSGWLPVVLAVVGTIVVASILCWFLPDLVQFADNLITVFAPD